MTMPMSEDRGVLREWTPLTAFLQQVPAKMQNGLFTHDINLTCIDAVPEFIAVGTNHGLIYWYDREKQDLQRLRCENPNGKITRVCVASTVDYMVAAGNDQGVITVFQIPKDPPDSLPDSLKPKQKKQVERYTISGLHKSAVTAVKWSKNGMKLFSGDQEGSVVLTEIDFYMHISKSSELLNEKYTVVQLSYLRGMLLVSTTLRTILVNRNENNKVTQVGQKERKLLAKLGATFAERQCLNPQDALIYASRPGLRLWQADRSGTVSKTLIFKEAVEPDQTRVQLLNPAPERALEKAPPGKAANARHHEPTFGILLPFSDELLVTYSHDLVYVVNPRTIGITAVVSDVRRVCDVACTKEEIFILEGDRNVIRLAYYPDARGAQLTTDGTNTTGFMEPIATFADIGKPVATGILEFTSKLKESAVIPAISVPKIPPSHVVRSAIDPAGAVVVGKAEEALETLPAAPATSDLLAPLITDVNEILEFNDSSQWKDSQSTCAMAANDRRMIFQKIAEQEFEDVLFTPQRRTKRQRKKCNSVANVERGSIDSNKLSTTLIDEQHLENGINGDISTKTIHSSLLTLSAHDAIDGFMGKPERNLETLREDVASKEKLLADVLDFDLSKYTTNNKSAANDASRSLASIDHLNFSNTDDYALNSTSGEHDDGVENIDQAPSHDEKLATESNDASEEEDASYGMELKKLEELGECGKQVLRNKLLIESPGALPSSTAQNGTKHNIADISHRQSHRQVNTAKECTTMALSGEDEEEEEREVGGEEEEKHRTREN